MPIASTDILLKLSEPTTPGNAHAGTAEASFGGFISTTAFTDASLNNLFPDITGDENAADNVDYACLFVHNNHATLTLQNAKLFISSQVSGGANVAVAVDDVGITAIGASSAQSDTIADKDTAPTAVGSFSAPTSDAGGLTLGNIGPGECIAIWIQRTATNSSALSNDGATIEIQGDTAA